MAWGFHLSLDLGRCCKKAITNELHITAFVKHLVKDIDMVAYGPCHIKKFGTGNKAGYSAFQLIETSNIALHLCDETGDTYIDIFSCKPYDREVVKRLATDYFKPKAMIEHYIERKAPELQ